MEMFKGMAGVDIMHVPYKSSILAVTELGSGQVHLLCSAIPTLHATLQSGKARALGVTSREPSKLAPGVPAISATVPGFDMDGWYGIIAPLGTPKDIVAKLNGAFAQVLKLPEVQERLLGVGAELVARAAPDGHTLWMATMTQLISTTLYQRFVMSKEFAPVGQVASTPFVIAVSAGVPTIMETVPGYELVGWYGLLAPLNTPKDIVERINLELAKALKISDLQERLIAVGAEAAHTSPAEYGAFLRRETVRWSKVLKDAGIKPAP